MSAKYYQSMLFTVMTGHNPIGGKEREDVGVTWSRVVMRHACEALIRQLPYQRLHCLEISGETWETFGFRSYRSISYPDYDLCAAPLQERYDLIIAEQVFEHLLYPYRAGVNVRRMLALGGHFLVSVPFLVKVHEYPTDCSRWTEVGLRYFLHECGFPLEDIKSGAWGNRECVIANFSEWVTYDKDLHGLDNDPDFPYHVWALAARD
jgi:SAM-dependent methyltransferase